MISFIYVDAGSDYPVDNVNDADGPQVKEMVLLGYLATAYHYHKIMLSTAQYRPVIGLP